MNKNGGLLVPPFFLRVQNVAHDFVPGALTDQCVIWDIQNIAQRHSQPGP